MLGIVILAAAAGWAAITVFCTERPEVPPAEYLPAVWPLWCAPYACVHTRLLGLLIFVGVIVDALIAQFRSGNRGQRIAGGPTPEGVGFSI